MTNAEPSKKTYVVRGADRTTGESRVEVIDATDEKEASAFASARGLLVASIAEHHPGEPIADPKPKAEPDPEPIAKRRPSKRAKAKRQRESHWRIRTAGMQWFGLFFWFLSLLDFSLSGGSISGAVFGAALFITGSVSIVVAELGFILGVMLERIAQSLDAKDAGE